MRKIISNSRHISGKKQVHLAILVFSSVIYPVLIYHEILFGWWRFDDTQLIKFIMSNSLLEICFSPSVWQTLSIANFTPWIVFTLGFDLLVFDMRPEFFYLHQLLSLVGISVISYIFLRQWCPVYWSGFGVILFLSGATVFAIANQLMTRHYIEGLFFFILSLLIFRKALQRDRISISLWGALAYLLAMSAKEIYVTLLMAAFCWPEGNFRKRIKIMLPYFFAAVTFSLWRTYMLGWSIGGYGSRIESAGLIDYAKLPFLTAKAMVGDSLFALAALILVCLMILCQVLKSSKTALFAFFSVVALILPLIPVVKLMSGPDRFFILVWWSLAMALCVVFSRPAQSYWCVAWLKAICGFIFLVAVAWGTYQFNPAFKKIIHQYESVGRFTWNLDDSEAILFAPGLSEGSWYLSGIMWMKEQKSQGDGPKAIFADIVEFYELTAKRELNSRTVWKYLDSEKKVMEISSSIPGQVAAWQENVRTESLRLSFKYSNNMLYWNFGPYELGVYRLIFRDRLMVSGSMRLPVSGFVRSATNESLLFRLKYDSPDGWSTYSPWFEYEPTINPDLLWNRDLPAKARDISG